MLCQLSCVSQYCIVSYSIGNRNIFFIIWIITAQDKYIYLIWCQQICIFLKAIQRHISRWYHQITPLNQIWSFFFGGGGTLYTCSMFYFYYTHRFMYIRTSRKAVHPMKTYPYNWSIAEVLHSEPSRNSADNEEFKCRLLNN